MRATTGLQSEGCRGGLSWATISSRRGRGVQKLPVLMRCGALGLMAMIMDAVDTAAALTSSPRNTGQVREEIAVGLGLVG